MLRSQHFHCHGPGFNPCWGTMISQAVWYSQKKKSPHCGYIFLIFFVFKTTENCLFIDRTVVYYSLLYQCFSTLVSLLNLLRSFKKNFFFKLIYLSGCVGLSCTCGIFSCSVRTLTCMRHSSLIRKSTPGPLHWECRVLTAGAPETYL